MRYAKIVDGKFVYPTAMEFRGVPNWSAHTTLLRSHGYMPVKGDPHPPEGYYYEPVSGHVVPEGDDAPYIWVDSWEYIPIPEPEPEPEPPPAVRYSKYKIQLACQRRGLWEQVKGAIAQAGLQDSWSNIVDIASDNPELVSALPDIRKIFGSTLVDAVLAESVAD
jgi:hypothetical protein